MREWKSDVFIYKKKSCLIRLSGTRGASKLIINETALIVNTLKLLNCLFPHVIFRYFKKSFKRSLLNLDQAKCKT